MPDQPTQPQHESVDQWRSLEEHHDSSRLEEARASEFAPGVTDPFNPGQLSPMSRKQFLGLLAASAAFATAGCTQYRDKGEIVPYTRQPEEIIPGVPVVYASTCTGCGQSCGILVKTREGRPIKIDGNPDHPVNAGSVCARGQASILNLYDPDRLRTPLRGDRKGGGTPISWDEADAEARRVLTECTRDGKEVAVVAPLVQSPTFAALLRDFAGRFPTARVYSYELFHEEARRNAWRRCYGNDDVPSLTWDGARLILLLEADVLGTEGSFLEQIRGFAQGRDVLAKAGFSRLYVTESGFSQTGANADYRLRLRPDSQAAFVLGLLHEILLVRRAARADRWITEKVAAYPLARVQKEHNLAPEVLSTLLEDLLAHRGEAIVYAGRTLGEDAHVAVHLLNEILGNTVLYRNESGVAPLVPLTTADRWSSLTGSMKAGAVGAVVHVAANAVFDLPRSMGYADALAAVPHVFSMVELEDETSALSTLTLPVHTMLESWGDAESRHGVLSLQQPMIASLHNTRQKEAILLGWMDRNAAYRDTVYHEYLRTRWERDVYPRTGSPVDFTRFWFAGLESGVVILDTRAPGRTPADPRAFLDPPATAGSAQTVVVFAEHPFVGNGRLANNGWLQELPHPITRVVWDNYAAVSPANAAALGVTTGDMVDLEVESRRLVIPVFVQPGMHDNVVIVTRGHGRWKAGTIGTGVGTDVAGIVPASTVTGPSYAPALISRREGRHALVTTQEHHALDDSRYADLQKKRKIIREGTVDQFARDPEFLRHEHHELFSISKEVTYSGLKWAMAIDMNKCVGCAACVSACNVENNVPVVGKEQVALSREMQWIRIDRYFSGTPEEPTSSHQPMLCQHCDNAPCENVCPVVATSHSPDGLNQMAYNRCVGTKYCSNNCPYKVRRFNFLNFRDNLADGYQEQDILSLLHNPEVTVRSRGVMEKCTFCLQRIMEARQHAVEEGRDVRGSDVRTACQEACPARAIVFGDMNDEQSDVTRYRTHPLGYHVLEEINVRPNVTYLARLRNIEPEDRTR